MAQDRECPCCENEERVPDDPEGIVEKVRERYGRIADEGQSYCCAADGTVAERIGYDADDVSAAPEGANLGLGCGAPIRHLDLRPGEVALDLGSGAGFDAFLAAPLVGERGRVIGVDMTPEMIRRARANAASAGHRNVEFRQGRLEELPLDDASVNAVTSNCVINLVPDKGKVYREAARVLVPGGRIVVSDIVLDGDLPEVLRGDLLAYVGCVAGALRREAYFSAVADAGFGRIEILEDKDYLAAVGDDLLPPEVRALLDRHGLRAQDVEGRVRSITFRAIRQ